MKISGIFVCLNTDTVANIRYLPFRKGYFFPLIIAQTTPTYRQNHVNRQACFHLENCPIHRGYIYRFVRYDYIILATQNYPNSLCVSCLHIRHSQDSRMCRLSVVAVAIHSRLCNNKRHI